LGYTDVITHHFPDDDKLVAHLDKKVGGSDILCNYRKDYILISDRIKNQIISVDILTDYLRFDKNNYVSSHLPIELVISL